MSGYLPDGVTQAMIDRHLDGDTSEPLGTCACGEPVIDRGASECLVCALGEVVGRAMGEMVCTPRHRYHYGRLQAYAGEARKALREGDYVRVETEARLRRVLLLADYVLGEE